MISENCDEHFIQWLKQVKLVEYPNSMNYLRQDHFLKRIKAMPENIQTIEELQTYLNNLKNSHLFIYTMGEFYHKYKSNSKRGLL